MKELYLNWGRRINFSVFTFESPSITLLHFLLGHFVNVSGSFLIGFKLLMEIVLPYIALSSER